MTEDNDNAQPEARPTSGEPQERNLALEETERLAARQEPMTPGQKQATEAARKGLRGWLAQVAGRRSDD